MTEVAVVSQAVIRTTITRGHSQLLEVAVTALTEDLSTVWQFATSRPAGESLPLFESLNLF